MSGRKAVYLNADQWWLIDALLADTSQEIDVHPALNGAPAIARRWCHKRIDEIRAEIGRVIEEKKE